MLALIYLAIRRMFALILLRCRFSGVQGTRDRRASPRARDSSSAGRPPHASTRRGVTVKTGVAARSDTNGALARDELERLGDMQAVLQEPTDDREVRLQRVNAALKAV